MYGATLGEQAYAAKAASGQMADMQAMMPDYPCANERMTLLTSAAQIAERQTSHLAELVGYVERFRERLRGAEIQKGCDGSTAQQVARPAAGPRLEQAQTALDVQIQRLANALQVLDDVA